MPIEVEGMIGHLETKEATHRVLDLLDAGITKFGDLSTLKTDEVIVLFVPVGFFVLGEIFTKLVFGDKIAADQELKRIVNRGPADSVVALLHMEVESFGVEVIIAVVDLLQDGESLGGLSETVIFKVIGETIPDFREDLFLDLGYCHSSFFLGIHPYNIGYAL